MVIVEIQRDFLPGGSLAVPGGDAVVPAMRRCMKLFEHGGLPIFATRDWHPPDHCSFRAQGGPWPPHCVAGSRGAQFAGALQMPASANVISKATTPGKDSYSGFEDTDLDAQLRALRVRRLFVGGLATDYCVLNTVRDALRLGYAVVLLTDACGALDVNPGDGRRALDEMQRLGARLVESADLPE